MDIRLADGTKVPGEIVGSDTYSDIAVVKITADKVTTVAEFGDSDQLTVGETAIAIGSPQFLSTPIPLHRVSCQV